MSFNHRNMCDPAESFNLRSFNSAQVLDLGVMSADEIIAAARATAAADPFAAKLLKPPGVRCSRQAFMTGAPLAIVAGPG